MDKQAAILEYLRRFHTGRNKAIYSRELQQLFDLDGRSLRRKISRLRKDGYPICSDENGYFFASCQSEIDTTVFRLNDLEKQVARTRNALYGAAMADVGLPIQVQITIG